MALGRVGQKELKHYDCKSMQHDCYFCIDVTGLGLSTSSFKAHQNESYFIDLSLMQKLSTVKVL